MDVAVPEPGHDDFAGVIDNAGIRRYDDRFPGADRRNPAASDQDDAVVEWRRLGRGIDPRSNQRDEPGRVGLLLRAERPGEQAGSYTQDKKRHPTRTQPSS
jgi:hypothetical protein